MPLWEGRLGHNSAEELRAFSWSLHFDRRLRDYDIANSQAHVRGLVKAGILTKDDGEAIQAALKQVKTEMDEDKFVYVEDDEDIHTAIERRVTEIAGPTGAKLHTGRSRNDQVTTDLRMFTKDALTEIADRVLELQQVLLDRATNVGDVYVPGYTHSQRAQSILLAHYLLAHAWSFSRDIDRLFESRSRSDVSPLGAGALGGSSLPLDPDSVAEDLGFASRFENSLDAVSDRDYIGDALYSMSMLWIHLSRMAEEIVQWNTSEFGFIELADEFATGSSMLPQKKNPDIAELTRGKSGRILGNLTGFLTTLKGLPLGYNRDFQEDKEPLFDSVDQTLLALNALIGLWQTIGFNADAMREAGNDQNMVAIDLAEMLVSKGMPFREAHSVVGDMIRQAGERHVPLSELIEAQPLLGTDALPLLTPGTSVQRRVSPGGGGSDSVSEQMQKLKERIATDRARLSE